LVKVIQKDKKSKIAEIGKKHKNTELLIQPQQLGSKLSQRKAALKKAKGTRRSGI
jgi:hypothetical protein